MAIKNILFTLASVALLTSCSQIKTRSEINQHAPSTQNSSGPSIPQPKVEPPPAPAKGSTQVGIILGPGGMKSFAHLGVLEQFDKARIPIRAIVGLEWGSLVAALYSVQARAYDAEWRMLKMTESDLPSSHGLLSSQLQPQDISVMQRFLQGAFPEEIVERGSIPFSCPSQSTQSGELRWHTSGTYISAVQHCLPYPPYFRPFDNSVAAPMNLREAVEQLRAQGANLIIFVDVLAEGGMMNARMAQDNPTTYLLWLALQGESHSLRELFNEVIVVNTHNNGLTDFAARRSMLQAGQQAGHAAVQMLAQKYGL